MAIITVERRLCDICNAEWKGNDPKKPWEAHSKLPKSSKPRYKSGQMVSIYTRDNYNLFLVIDEIDRRISQEDHERLYQGYPLSHKGSSDSLLIMATIKYPENRLHEITRKKYEQILEDIKKENERTTSNAKQILEIINRNQPVEYK